MCENEIAAIEIWTELSLRVHQDEPITPENHKRKKSSKGTEAEELEE